MRIGVEDLDARGQVDVLGGDVAGTGDDQRRLDLGRVAECIRQTMPFRFSTMSVTSSLTPRIVENSWATPSIRTLVTAAPASDESSTRRSELPNV